MRNSSPGLVIGVAAALLAVSAVAQTIDALATIAQFESGGRNIPNYINDSTHTASGPWQITNSTWNGTIAPNTGLPTVGPGTGNPNGAMDLSIAQQQQGAAYLFQTQGFTPWTCGGCNTPLRNYVADNGGASAFGLTGSGLAGDTMPVNNTGGALPAQATVTVGNAQPSTPFTNSYNFVRGTIINSLNQSIAQTLAMAEGPLGGLLMLWALIIGLSVMLGWLSLPDAWSKIIRVLIVIVLLNNSGLFNQYITDFILNGLPTWIAQNLSPAGAGASPAAAFDAALTNFWIAASRIWAATPLSGTVFMALILASCLAVIATALVGMFIVFLMLTAMLSLVVVISPLMILGLLFDFTRRFFNATVSVVVVLLLAILVVDLLVTVLSGGLAQQLASIQASGSVWQDAIYLSGISIQVVILGATVLVAPRIIESIGGASAGVRMVAPLAVARLAGIASRRFNRTIHR